MTKAKKSLAQACLHLSSKISPREREDWFEAMVAELNHVPDAKLLHFAAGCLFAAVKARITSPAFILAAAHCLLVGGAAVWAILNLSLIARTQLANIPWLEIFAYCMAATFLCGAIATARSGFKATIGLGIPLIFLLGTAGLALKLMIPPSPTSALYFALIVEDFITILLALLIAFAASRLAAIKQEYHR